MVINNKNKNDLESGIETFFLFFYSRTNILNCFYRLLKIKQLIKKTESSSVIN